MLLPISGLAGGERPPAGSAAEESVFFVALVAALLAVAAAGVPLWAWAARVPDMRRRPEA